MPDAAVFQSQFARAIAAKAPPAEAPPAFAVYRNTWLKGLLDALDANYPTVAMIVGADLFRAVASQFAREHPPRNPVLASYGASFPDFLAHHPVSRDISYLRDIARLERLWTECFFAPDAPGLESSDYAVLKPAEMLGLSLRLHTATRFERFETPAVTIWHAHRQQGDFQEIEPEWTAECALITRSGMRIAVTLIDDATRRLLSEIQGGRTIGDAIAKVAEVHPDGDLAAALATAISSAAFAAPQAEDERIW